MAMRPAVFILGLVVFAALTACSSKAESKGQEQVFNVSYETVTNRVSALKPNPAADMKPHGYEIVPGQSYGFGIPEGPQGDVSGIYTTITATSIDLKSTRVEIKTIKIGIIFNRRDRQIEKQRLNELSYLLSNNH